MQAVLHGQSLSGLVSQIYLIKRRERVAGIVLINTVALVPKKTNRWGLHLLKLLPGSLLRSVFGRKMKNFYKQALTDPETETASRFGLAHLDDIMANHFEKKRLINIMSMLYDISPLGYSRHDLGDWQGSALIIVSEDDAGYKDIDWWLENLPRARSEILPAGLGHVPHLKHRKRIEDAVRGFLEEG